MQGGSWKQWEPPPLPRSDLEINLWAEVVTPTATEWAPARSGRGFRAEEGADPRDDGLRGSRPPSGTEMISRTDLNPVSDRTFHCLLLLHLQP